MSMPTLNIDFYSDDVIADPYPVYAKLRELVPVVYLPKNNLYAISRYSDDSRPNKLA